MRQFVLSQQTTKMTSYLSFAVVALALAAACVDAQTGSVHCGVGCACSELSRPVCASDGRTYLNECTLRCQQCEKIDLEIKHEGVCDIRYRQVVEPIAYRPAPLVQYAFAPPTPSSYIVSLVPNAGIPHAPVNFIPQYRYTAINPLPVPVAAPVPVVKQVVEHQEKLAPIFILNKKI